MGEGVRVKFVAPAEVIEVARDELQHIRMRHHRCPGRSGPEAEWDG